MAGVGAMGGGPRGILMALAQAGFPPEMMQQLIERVRQLRQQRETGGVGLQFGGPPGGVQSGPMGDPSMAARQPGRGVGMARGINDSENPHSPYPPPPPPQRAVEGPPSNSMGFGRAPAAGLSRLPAGPSPHADGAPGFGRVDVGPSMAPAPPSGPPFDRNSLPPGSGGGSFPRPPAPGGPTLSGGPAPAPGGGRNPYELEFMRYMQTQLGR